MLEATDRGCLGTLEHIETEVWKVWAAGAGVEQREGRDKQEFHWSAQRLVPAL